MTRLLFATLLLLSFRLSAQTCIAHRAIVDDALENSLEGISSAVNRGVTGLEFDVHFTKDGVPLLYHNKRLKKFIRGPACPKGKKIKKLYYSEIKNNCFLENGERVPLLRDALTILKDYPGFIFFELKAKPKDTFFTLLNEFDLQNNPKLKILSFKKGALRRIKRKWDEVQTLLLSLIIPRGLFYRNVGFNKHLKIFIPFFRWLKKGVGIYTLNEKRKILKAVRKKADFIITDEYDLCLETLNEV
ncbi:MAG: glycerophosphodiester phosphodiesterase [Halobacteriovoraceae bacterium]|nr:glycerophosphodiester phosphodiesterase [Halobacteriovoraceae bacterium]